MVHKNMWFVNRATMRAGVVVVFFVVYTLLTLFMVSRMQQECLSAKDIAHELSLLKYEKEYSDLGKRIQSRYSQREESMLREAQPAKDYDDSLHYENDKLRVEEILITDALPNTVYYVWCGNRWFEFPHYLSIMSVMKVIKPDNLVFLYDVYPVVDSWTYNTWFKELREKFPFMRVQQLTKEDDGCATHSKANPAFLKRLLAERGGIYINEVVIIANLPPNIRSYDIVDAMDWKEGVGFFMVKKGRIADSPPSTDVSGTKKKRLECIHVDEYTSQKVGRVSCLYQTMALFPKDIWNLESPFGRLARYIFYGSTKIKRPTPSNTTLVPNIAHVVWLGGGSMDFLFLLCILSLLNVAKVEAVYLHGDGPPTGPYWDLIKHDKRLHLIYRDYPGTVYGTEVKVLSHITDIWRVDFMVKYGGIYVDTDTVFVKPLDSRIRSYDAVATYDWTYWNHPFPDTINFGVSIGKRNAKYWHLFQESMKWFEDADWSWNGLRRPYKVQEQHPDLILIDPHLSVICFKSLCHPTWWPDYHNESVHHLNSKSITNWRKDVYAFHWTLPTPYELLNHTTLLTTYTMFSEIGTYVLRKSNLLEHFKQKVADETKILNS